MPNPKIDRTPQAGDDDEGSDQMVGQDSSEDPRPAIVKQIDYIEPQS